jgi:hypothetical protein
MTTQVKNSQFISINQLPHKIEEALGNKIGTLDSRADFAMSISKSLASTLIQVYRILDRESINDFESFVTRLKSELKPFTLRQRNLTEQYDSLLDEIENKISQNKKISSFEKKRDRLIFKLDRYADEDNSIKAAQILKQLDGLFEKSKAEEFKLLNESKDISSINKKISALSKTKADEGKELYKSISAYRKNWTLKADDYFKRSGNEIKVLASRLQDVLKNGSDVMEIDNCANQVLRQLIPVKNKYGLHKRGTTNEAGKLISKIISAKYSKYFDKNPTTSKHKGQRYATPYDRVCDVLADFINMTIHTKYKSSNGQKYETNMYFSVGHDAKLTALKAKPTAPRK